MVLDEDRQVAHVAWSSGNALRHLALEHQDEPLWPRRPPQEAMQDRTRDVVRHVGHDFVGRLHELGDALIEDVAPDQSERPGLDRARMNTSQPFFQTSVQLDGGYGRASIEKPACQDAQPRSDLQNPAPRLRGRQVKGGLQYVWIRQEVL